MLKYSDCVYRMGMCNSDKNADNVVTLSPISQIDVLNERHKARLSDTDDIELVYKHISDFKRRSSDLNDSVVYKQSSRADK